jgi:hypothetical protein
VLECGGRKCEELWDSVVVCGGLVVHCGVPLAVTAVVVTAAVSSVPVSDVTMSVRCGVVWCV